MKTQKEKKEESQDSLVDNASIVLYNDNVNSFDHVILCLKVFCGHSALQAEQCAMIVHNKGKYAVKEGNLEELLAINDALQLNLLNSQIEFS